MHLEETGDILVTGCAGFIGFHLTKRLLQQGKRIIGLDNMNGYYDVTLKKSRLRLLEECGELDFHRISLEDSKAVSNLFEENNIKIVINLAAQAGVRYSLLNPQAYIDSNITGFLNILEACRFNKVRHLIFASSSSVYGANTKIPFSVHDNVDHPVSLYAATKKSNELMAHTYSHIFGLAVTGLRFFTVYGPWGRPDMALFLFTKAILEGKPIDVFNNGEMMRDFTYVEDIVEGIYRLIDRTPEPNPGWDAYCPDPGTSSAPYRVYNIGNNQPVRLEDFISTLEEKLRKKAIKNYLPLQAGDVSKTYADVDDLIRDVGFKPQTAISDGIEKFVGWYREYYQN
jgi:UDP-glucuronate 4-epimerase